MADDARSTSLAKPKEKEKTILDLLRDPKVKSGLDGIATKYLTADRLTRITINAISRVPKLAQATPRSVLGAIMMSCATGLEPNTVQGHAYLIPRDTRKPGPDGKWMTVTECQFMPGYRGFIVMAKRNPDLIKMHASVVCENDLFEFYDGSEMFLKFAPSLGPDGRGNPIAAYCMTTERREHGEAHAATVLPWEEIEKIRAMSETWKFLAAQAQNADDNTKDGKKAIQKFEATPWVLWEGEMSMKSAVRRHVKQLDLSHGLGVVTELDAISGAGVIDLEALADPDHAKAVAEGEAPVPTKERTEPDTSTTLADPRKDPPGDPRDTGTKETKTQPQGAALKPAKADPTAGMDF